MRLSAVNPKPVRLQSAQIAQLVWGYPHLISLSRIGYDKVVGSNPAGCASCEGLLVRPTSAHDEGSFVGRTKGAEREPEAQRCP